MTAPALNANLDASASPGRQRITVRPAPRREPPYDDEARHLQLVGPHDRALPFDHPERRPKPANPLFDRGGLPDPEPWARQMVIAVLAARSGHCPPQQLSRWLTRGVQLGVTRDLSRTVSKRRTASPPSRVRTVRVCEPAPGVAEIAAVVQSGGRVRAIAARLEGRDGDWRCVRLQIG